MSIPIKIFNKNGPVLGVFTLVDVQNERNLNMEKTGQANI